MSTVLVGSHTLLLPSFLLLVYGCPLIVYNVRSKCVTVESLQFSNVFAICQLNTL